MDIQTTCLCAKLRKASRVITGIYDGFLAETGVKITQYSLLNNVKRLQNATAAQLSQALLMDKTTLSRNLRLLVKRGYLAETPGEDRRVKELTLTEQGAKALANARPAWLKAQKLLRESLGGSRMDRLFEDLSALEELA